jgi:hypothetical protein
MVTRARLFSKHDSYSSYKAGCTTKHSWHHSLQAWRHPALCGNMSVGHLTNVWLTVVLPRAFRYYADDIGWMGQHVVLLYVHRKVSVCEQIMIETIFLTSVYGNQSLVLSQYLRYAPNITRYFYVPPIECIWVFCTVLRTVFIFPHWSVFITV